MDDTFYRDVEACGDAHEFDALLACTPRPDSEAETLEAMHRIYMIVGDGRRPGRALFDPSAAIGHHWFDGALVGDPGPGPYPQP
jgi:hypothetical protein